MVTWGIKFDRGIKSKDLCWLNPLIESDPRKSMKSKEQENIALPSAQLKDDQKHVQEEREQGRTPYRRDGCRAWLVCLCAVLSNTLLFGSTQTFGVMFPVLLDEFREGKAKTALVGSLALAMTMTCSPISAKLIKLFGPRRVTIVGGIVSGLGLFMSSFIPGISFLYLTYSFTLGLGISLAYMSNYDIVPRYFKKRIGLATGLMQAGSGAAFFVSLLVEALLTHVGWRQTFKIMSGIIMIVCLCGLTFSVNVESDTRPITQKKTMVVYERIPTARSTNIRLIILCVFSLFFQFGNAIPLIHLGRHAQDCGLNLSQIAYLYVGFGVASVIGRLLSGKTGDIKYLDPCHLLFLTAILAGVSTILCPFARTFTNLLVYFCANGICDGFHATLTIVIILRNTSAEQATKWTSIFLFIISFGFAFGPPFGGFIADRMDSYVPVFYMSGTIVLFSSLIIKIFMCVRPRSKQSKNIEGTLKLLYEEQMVIAEKLTVL